MAESILRKLVSEQGITDIEVDSAGLRNYEGTPRDATLSAIANAAGYELGGVARKISQSTVDSADLIICMEHHQLVEMQKMYVPYVRWSALLRFNEICFGERSDMPDPSGDTYYMYHYVFDRIEQGVRNLLNQLSR